MCQPSYSTAQPIRASLVVEADAPFDLAAGSPISVDVNGSLMTIVVVSFARLPPAQLVTVRKLTSSSHPTRHSSVFTQPDCGVKAGEHFTARTVQSRMTPSTSATSLASAASDVFCDYSYSYFSAPSSERNLFSATETYSPAPTTTKRNVCTAKVSTKTTVDESDDDEYAYTYCT